mmetsp:Transcript_28102/g.50749  ORF Transcript_28102/g.50749 Transcript_28102/m.50749 type:complete len:81 (+) Transcript_28102:816-1058(+)
MQSGMRKLKFGDYWHEATTCQKIYGIIAEAQTDCSLLFGDGQFCAWTAIARRSSCRHAKHTETPSPKKMPSSYQCGPATL